MLGKLWPKSIHWLK
uniref:Facilitated trehalose transporter tret1-like protein n=1 Tax=Triatoma infestans TaxID=30076 RepID=A0A170WK94_TRIIF